MHVFILAGGSGSRLWPCSRTNFPKQFLNLFGDQSYLEKTVARFLKAIPSTHIWIITNDAYLHEVRAIVGKISPQLCQQIILEPEKKNTTAAIALGLSYLRAAGKLDSNEVVLVAPSDHLIEPEEQFLEAMLAAEPLVATGKILLFGIRPSSPETGYGYIHLGDPEEGQYYQVGAFIEKPTLEKAKEYLNAGTYLWNSGIVAFTYEGLYRELVRQTPLIAQALQQDHWTFLKAFASFNDQSLDYAILEKAENLSVIPLNITWSDIGSWDSLYQESPKDAQENLITGDVIAVDTHHSLILGSNRLICTLGIDNLLIIDTPDSLLIAQSGYSQEVKTLVETLNTHQRREVKEHLKVQRPWGEFTRLEEGSRYQIKKLMVLPGEKLSLQMHYHRSEHWVVTEGTAKVTVDDKEYLVHENEMVYVPKSAKHRLENPGKVPLLLIEIQVGEYLGEDDIVRFEDVYGRLKQNPSPVPDLVENSVKN